MRPEPLPRAALFAAGALALGLLIPTSLLAGNGTARFPAALVPVAGVIGYAALRLACLAASGEACIVTITFWVFVYVFLGLCPLLQLACGAFPLGGGYEETLLLRSALVVVAGIAAFEVGQRFAPAWLGAAAVPGVLRRRLHRPTIVVAGLVAAGIAAVLLQRLGGLEALFLPRVERHQLLSGQFGSAELLILNHLVRAPVFAVLIAALVVWSWARRGRTGAGWKAMCAGLLLATLLINNPISTPRLIVGTIALSLFFVLPWKRIHAALAAYGLVAGLILVFPLADAFRVTLDAKPGDQWEAASPARTLARSMDFDAFQAVANTVALVDREGVTGGAQVAGAVLFAVPRSLWPDKPLATGQLVGEKSGYAFTNLSAPLWTELYVDGGLLLVVAGFLAYGAGVRTLDRWYRWSQRGGGARVVSVLVPIYAGYQFFVLRGSLMPAVAYLTPIVLFALACSVPLRLPRASRGRIPCTS